jgi:hypothetical protein
MAPVSAIVLSTGLVLFEARLELIGIDQLCVKVAVSVIGPPIVIERGLAVPE